MSLMEYYSDIKKNEIVPFATIWMDLKIVILSEGGQAEKDISYMCNFKKWYK